jgi:hypothetical protein
VINRDESIQGAHMQTKEELLIRITVQAYADDLVFVSEREEGITQMLRIQDQFVE